VVQDVRLGASLGGDRREKRLSSAFERGERRGKSSFINSVDTVFFLVWYPEPAGALPKRSSQLLSD
jgi:hypothetical protein